MALIADGGLIEYGPDELLAACGTDATVAMISEAGQLLVRLPFDAESAAQVFTIECMSSCV